MRRRIVGLTMAMALGGTSVAAASAPAVSLRGSPAAMIQQNQVAKEHGLSFYRTGAEIRKAVGNGELVKLEGNENYAVAEFVSYPYLQPEGLLFIERLSAQYREACGQKLVVTSAVRPSSGQPSNAHRLSVHPAGMAVDLRVSDRAACREWLESALLGMESRGVLNGIRENRPPHYHVAIFPRQYMAYAEERMAMEAESAAEAAAEAAPAEASSTAPLAATLESAGGTAAFLASPAATTGTESKRAARATAALALIALPFGFGFLFRRSRRS